MASVALPTTILPANAFPSQFIEAGEAIAAGRVIRKGTDGKAYKASNSAVAIANVIGIAQTSSGGAGQMLAYWGPGVEVTASGLSKGVAYYLDHGTNEVQTITITGTPTGGTYTLTYKGQTTAAIAYNAVAATVQSALEALSTIGANNVDVTGTGPYVVTFQRALGGQDVDMIALGTNALTGGTSPNVNVVETTPGAGAGQLCPFADLVANEAITLLGVAKSTTSFVFAPIMTGATV